MKQLISLTAAALLLGLLLPENRAFAQIANDQLEGSSWRLISGRIEREGKKVHLTAPPLQGFLVFDSRNHFLIMITRSGPAKSSSNAGQAGNPGGNKAALQRSVACFGTYSINDADHTINVHIEGSTFPKWIGSDQKREFTLTGDKLTLTSSTLSGGTGIAQIVLGRVR
jgi:hypothetical protein